MSGKEQFKEVRDSYLDGIMSEYSVGKEAAYTILATALEPPAYLIPYPRRLQTGLSKRKQKQKPKSL